jgi:hypothetical protein
VHRLHIGDVPWNPVVIRRQFAFLAEKHREIQLRKTFPVPIVSPAIYSLHSL